MRIVTFLGVFALALAMRAQQPEDSKKEEKVEHAVVAPPDSTTENTVTVGGQKIAYKAVAGSITVGGTEAYDVTLGLDGQPLNSIGMNPLDTKKPEEAPATARMF